MKGARFVAVQTSFPETSRASRGRPARGDKSVTPTLSICRDTRNPKFCSGLTDVIGIRPMLRVVMLRRLLMKLNEVMSVLDTFNILSPSS